MNCTPASVQRFVIIGQPERTRVTPCRDRGARGFTLIELLAVVAIIGILASILIPTLSSARTASNKARTRTQFSQWGAAFESFRQEYGSYPQLSPQGALKVVNPTGTSTNAQAEHLFHDTLTGHRRDPSGTWPAATTRNPPMPQAQNTRRIQFVSFTDDDFVVASDVTAGLNPNNQLNWIRDGFHNTSIACITDANLDGVINGRDTTGGYPGVTVSGSATTLRPLTTDLTTGTTGGVHAGVIFYSAPPGASTGSDLIMSWK
jgi:prepilin-type N-terminal cleavage/methylation domain-containing protein